MITGNDEVREELLRSKSFLNWTPDSNPKRPPPTISFGRGRSFTYQGKRYTNLVVDEKHFTPADLAKAWGLSAEKVRQLFRTEPGVLRIGTNGGSRDRGYVTLRIPQSVAVRVHTRLTAIPQTR
jgi:hypothetical protein